jgi:hypothetical protein
MQSGLHMNQPPPRRHSSPDALLQRYYSLLLPWRPPLDADAREHTGCILPAACPAKIWPTSTRVVVPSRLYHSRCQAAASASMPDASARSRSPKASSPAAALASPHLIFIEKKDEEAPSSGLGQCREESLDGKFFVLATTALLKPHGVTSPSRRY